jgi:hypothetical protein
MVQQVCCLLCIPACLRMRRYTTLIKPEKAGSSPYRGARVQGEPSAKDLLVTFASHCMEPSSGGTPVRPKQVLLAYRYSGQGNLSYRCVIGWRDVVNTFILEGACKQGKQQVK